MSLLLTVYSVTFTVGLVVSSLGVILIWLFHLLGLSYGFYKFHRKPKSLSNNSKELPGISIIKPLTGVDPHLENNLETFFRLNYPRYEILFCVQDHDQRLVNIIERLRQRYVHVDTHLFVGSSSSIIEQRSETIINDDESDQAALIEDGNRPTSPRKTSRWKRIFFCGKKSSPVEISSNQEIKNPKIANMLPAYENAQYSFILISDSGMIMQEDTLYDMVSLMTDDVGLVHQMPFTCDKNGFAGSLEKVYFGTQHARMYMTINLVGINCVTGMSCLVRKQCLDHVGGLKAFADYIAEDFYMAYEVTKQGWKIRVASSPALQNSGDYSIERWIERMIRWFKLRMRLSPMAFLEPFQECFSSAILAGLVTNYLFDWNSLVIAACHILVWFILDYCMLRITQGGPLPFHKSEFAVAWLIRELLSYYIYFKAFTGSSIIKWRGKEYRLGSGTRAEEIPSTTTTTTMKVSKPALTVPTLHIQSPASESQSALLSV